MTFGVLAAVAASSPTASEIEPGALGFLVVAGIGVVLVFLLRSMNKQFRKIEVTHPGDPDNPADPDDPDDGAPDGAPRQEAGAVQERPK